jgi:hypothetical protein
VVVRCFDYKRRDLKITNFIFNEWINDCKNRMLSPFPDPLQPPQENCWQTQPVEWKPRQLNWQDTHASQAATSGQEAVTAGRPKQFAPIILSTIG